MFIGLNAGGNIASVAITTRLYVPFSAILATILLREMISFMRVMTLTGILLVSMHPEIEKKKRVLEE